MHWLKMQHAILGVLDNTGNKAVRLFTMDFPKAFDNVRHHLLVEKLKTSPLSLPMVNWYISFLTDRKQRVISDGTVCKLGKEVNKWTTQGRVSGPCISSYSLTGELLLPNKRIIQIWLYRSFRTGLNKTK